MIPKVSVSVLAISLAFLLSTKWARAQEQLPVLVHEDFENGMDRWETTDPAGDQSVWLIEPVRRGRGTSRVLRVTGPSKYEPPYRSPLSIAWLKDEVVGNFELTVEAQNTNYDAGAHRDLCIFWGRQDPSKFYYVHLGAVRDPNSCQVFIVNDARRRPISDNKESPLETHWTRDWHKVKVVRDVDSGSIEVYFDDMTQPHMTARDKTFAWGRVGLGTFDDNGNFDELVLRGQRVEREEP